MRTFLFITLLLCSAGLPAQVDSFMVEGKVFRFEIPQDWVLEEKADGVQGDSTWNIVLRYAVDVKDLNGRLAVRIIRKETLLAGNEGASRPSTRFIQTTSDQVISDFFGYEFRSETKGNSCKTCKKKYDYVFLTPLNQDLLICSAFSGYGTKPVTDSLRKHFNPFTASFLSMNKSAFRHFQPNINDRIGTKSDSLFMLGKYHRFLHDTGWIFIRDSLPDKEVYFQNKLLLAKETPSGELVIFSVDLIKTPGNKTIQKKISEQQNRALGYRFSNDRLDSITRSSSIANYDGSHYYAHLSPDPNRILFFVEPDTSICKNCILQFSVQININDQMYYYYYKNLLMEYIAVFLEINQIKAERIGETLFPDEIELQPLPADHPRYAPSPAQAPEPAPKRTTVD